MPGLTHGCPARQRVSPVNTRRTRIAAPVPGTCSVRNRNRPAGRNPRRFAGAPVGGRRFSSRGARPLRPLRRTAGPPPVSTRRLVVAAGSFLVGFPAFGMRRDGERKEHVGQHFGGPGGPDERQRTVRAGGVQRVMMIPERVAQAGQKTWWRSWRNLRRPVRSRRAPPTTSGRVGPARRDGAGDGSPDAIRPISTTQRAARDVRARCVAATSVPSIRAGKRAFPSCRRRPPVRGACRNPASPSSSPIDAWGSARSTLSGNRWASSANGSLFSL